MSQPPPLPTNVPPAWFARHWKWFVPVLALATAAVILGFFWFVISVVKQSDAYQIAVARARASPGVVEALGTPITEGFLVLGNIHVTNSAGLAQLEFPLHGPKGEATVYVAAEKAEGVWHFEYLVVEIASSHARIILSDPAPPPRHRVP